MDKFKKLFNYKAYRWLIGCARPHRWTLLLLVLINVFASVSSVATAVVSRPMIDLAVDKNMQKAIGYAAVFAVILLLKSALSGFGTMMAARLSEVMGNRIQREFLQRMHKIQWMELNRYHSGDIMTRLTSDVANVVNGWVNQLPSILSLGLQLIFAFLALLYFDSTLALCAFAVGPVSIAFSWFYGRKLKKLQHYIQAAESRCRAFMQELTDHMLIVKTFAYDKEAIKRMRSYQQEKLRLVKKRSRLGFATNFMMAGGYWSGYFLAFGWGAFKLSTQSTTFGTFTAFLQLVGQIQGPFDGLSRTVPQLISTLASAERLSEFENLETEAEKTEDLLRANVPVSLVMERVSFGYKQEKPVLKEVSLSVKAGEIIALTGISGEGKTTVLRMLLFLIKPMSGKVYLIGKENRRQGISTDTRSYFSYVPQGNTLFSGTIAENLRIGNPGASEEELVKVMKAACAWDFVSSLPDGSNTRIGERGLGLSEGQVQRLSIARALLKPSPILLLDEATSALDMDTEREVLENIRNLQPARTCIAVTHRLSVFYICDRVYRLSHGTLTEQNLKDYLGRNRASG